MWTFLYPKPDGTVYTAMLGGLDLTDAFNGFARYHWNPDMPAVGVWRNSCLEARILPRLNLSTLQMEATLIEH